MKAVGTGEKITGRVKVTPVRADNPVCTLKTEVSNAEREICLTGSATTYTVPLRGLAGGEAAP